MTHEERRNAPEGQKGEVEREVQEKGRDMPMLPYNKGFQTVTVYDPKTSKQNMR